ncbi:MAG: hypothetical protein TH68_07870 [Candidatus Synechococcus spongiarum 142]|uniref:Uncharacterized protein n=1 Tax=Candidatus Synechococcus spongiarum 142 TaxID=1608213 RepID=A0A6N3X7C7_9SYNE|nr:MAG: hypothetical protein TH68_07870 [Candidatus Synechococcus spongiarum 142]
MPVISWGCPARGGGRDDLFCSLGPGPLLSPQKQAVSDQQAAPTSGLWPSFWWQPRTLEELHEQVRAEDQGLLLTQLFQLQLDGAVRSLPGLRWVRIR